MQKISIKAKSQMMALMTINQLRKAQHGLEAPFTLRCHEKTFVCLSVMRHLPGKRLTCIAELNGQTVLLKLFFASKQRHLWHAKLDIRGSQQLTAAKIATPKALATRIVFGAKYSYVAYDYLPTAMTLNVLLQQSTSLSEQEKQLHDLMQVIIKMHQQGLWQADLHFDNFLIQDGVWYVVDTAAIQGAVGKYLPKSTCLRNIALLLAQFTRNQSALIEKLSAIYLDARAWQQNEITNYLKSQRWRRESKFLAKTLRNCSRYTRVIDSHRLIISVRSSLGKAAQAVLQRAVSGVLPKSFMYLKQGNSSTLLRIDLQQTYFVLKRYNLKTRWHALRRSCQPSRAANTWKFGHLLQLLGIATPEPVAFAERRWWIFRRQAFILYTYYQGIPLDRYISTHIEDSRKWQTVLCQTVTILEQLAEASLIHHDLKASNFLVTESAVLLLDLDAMQRIGSSRRWQRMWQKDKQRFLANFSEHARIQAYCGELFKQVNL